jgi:hypothetical protein
VALSDLEVDSVRHHLGYPSVSIGAGIGLGMPTLVQALFPVEGALNHLYPSAEATIRTLIARCDTAEARIFESEDVLDARRIGDIEVNPDVMDRRREAYRYWVRRLSEATGAPINPESQQGGTSVNLVRLGM